ncbi:PREDICTED: uncharacterized protein LOC103609186 [Galeopterus variegatus]|uniref:Uncharacterized protein LOC103609186 n=1 Tax=Galeopterus variegatus TaxID=482537 RepID=A0ABM0SFY0_GALVR|nr:PREDICTED: uncharacterized protein LOC103609186 [Galeopterus variegatus]
MDLVGSGVDFWGLQVLHHSGHKNLQGSVFQMQKPSYMCNQSPDTRNAVQHAEEGETLSKNRTETSLVSSGANCSLAWCAVNVSSAARGKAFVGKQVKTASTATVPATCNTPSAWSPARSYRPGPRPPLRGLLSQRWDRGFMAAPSTFLEPPPPPRAQARPPSCRHSVPFPKSLSQRVRDPPLDRVKCLWRMGTSTQSPDREAGRRRRPSAAQARRGVLTP